MARRTWSWILWTLAACAALPAHAAPLRIGDVDIEIVSDERGVLRQYPVETRPHLKRAYIAVRPEERYRLRVVNHSGERIGLVIAVDGRNILNGRRSDLEPREAMYVLGPYERAEYEGWRTSRNRVARFYFTDAADSYAEAWGDRSALGVIAVAVYRERHPEPPAYRPEERGALGARSLRARPGTGFGEGHHSPSRRVQFEPRHRPDLRVFIKYEWRGTLCRKGIIACHRHQHREPPNRFWPDDGFAPYPWELGHDDD